MGLEHKTTSLLPTGGSVPGLSSLRFNNGSRLYCTPMYYIALSNRVDRTRVDRETTNWPMPLQRHSLYSTALWMGLG